MIKPSLSPYSSVLSSKGYCNICYSAFDFQDHRPLLVCTNDHSLCNHCLLALKHRLRCPFCRVNIRLDRIRLYQDAIDQLNLKSRKNSKIGLRISQPKIQNLRTQRISQNNQPEYLDPTEFIVQNQEIQQTSSILSALGEQKAMTYFVIIGLQLPLALLCVIVAIVEPRGGCFDVNMAGSFTSLRVFWMGTGLYQCFVALAGMLMLMWECLGPIRTQGGVPLLVLMFLVEISCILGILTYTNMLTSQMTCQYSLLVRNCLVVNLILDVVTLLLQIYLIGKFQGFYFDP